MQKSKSTKKSSSAVLNPKEDLRKSQILYRHLAELSPEAVVVHQEGIIVYANPTALKLIKAKKKSDLVGQSVMKFIHPDSVPLIQSRIKAMLSKDQVAPFVEEKFFTMKGDIFHAQTKAVPFTFQGKPAILAILNDITKQKKIENELKQSEERFRTLIEQSADAIQLLSQEGKILYSSNSIKRVLGFSPKELAGKIVLPNLHPDDVERFRNAFHTLLVNPSASVTLEYRVKHKNGSWAWIEATGVNHLENPSVKAIVGNFRNITQRKQEEERQAFLEQVSVLLGASIDYKTTLKNISKILVPAIADYIRIIIADDTNKLEEVVAYHSNPKKLRLVKKLFAAYKDRSDATHGVNHIIERGESEVIEKVTHKTVAAVKNHSVLEEIVTALNLTSYMGVPLKLQDRVIGAITFSSSRKEVSYSKEDLKFAEEIARRIAYAIENARLYNDAQKAIVIRNDFISLASHELKTPLTSLKMYTQTLERQSKKKEEHSYLPYLEKMNRQTDKLTQLVNDLLDVSKIQHGKLEFSFEELDLNDLVKDTVDAVQETTTQHTISIEGKIQRKVFADQYRIYQVLTNLLTNAIKYSPKTEKIIVRLHPEKDGAVVMVQDFGIGIQTSQQKKIFSQFYRVENPEEKTFPGLGMGLYISQEIVKRHGGTMSVTSHKGKGSQFTFTLAYLPNQKK